MLWERRWSQDTFERIEEAQKALRNSIEESIRLAEATETLVKQARSEADEPKSPS